MSFKIAMHATPRFRPTPFARLGHALLVMLCLLLLGLYPAHDSAAANDPAVDDAARRILTMLSAAGDDYREAVGDGHVVRGIELEEAKGFLEDAAGRLDLLPLERPVRQAL